MTIVLWRARLNEQKQSRAEAILRDVYKRQSDDGKVPGKGRRPCSKYCPVGDLPYDRRHGRGKIILESQHRCRASIRKIPATMQSPIRKIASARLCFCSLRLARQRTIVICSYECQQRCRAAIRKIASARLYFCSLRLARQRTFAIYSYECQHSTSIRQGSWLCIVATLHKFYIRW